ncbi:MAG: hypothetical protein A2133_09885 [Actinobacteria bacterium RBG_16_64_13]|nr:MAG: hypothetical protein A2133_09885 [Actinobacteria bacterium RBG_16_64_13]
MASRSQETLDQAVDAQSLPFSRKVAQTMPEEVIYAALSEVKDARRTGRLKESAGAYFTYLVKTRAKELGLEL